jgi:conjugative transfer signal peptidase TraF
MSASGRRIAAFAAGIFGGALLLTGAAYAVGVRWNVTPSVPTGLYLQTAVSLERGRLVVACPSPANPAVRAAISRGYLPPGHCPGGVAPLLKPIAALPGDRVTSTSTGLHVNGKPLPGTYARPADPQGRPLPTPPVAYTVPAGTVLLATSNPGSFDGRYFGPTAESSIAAGARPLLLF